MRQMIDQLQKMVSRNVDATFNSITVDSDTSTSDTLLIAATGQSKAAELNALGSTTTVDFYRHVIKPGASDGHYLAASKWFTAGWGLFAIGFALFARLAENLADIGVQFPRDDFHQRRLARTVAAEQADHLPLLDLQGDVEEDVASSVEGVDGIELEERHRNASPPTRNFPLPGTPCAPGDSP